MNKSIRTGLFLVISVTGASACTSVLGGFDFDGNPGSTSGTGGMTTTAGTGGMTTSSTGSGCSNPATDCPSTGTKCVVASCDGNTQCVTTNASPGVPCNDNGGQHCGDGTAQGQCVQCNAATQATDCPSQVCQSNVCVLATCGDGTKNTGESDVDCGGPSCGPCIDGKMCGGNGDCVSQICGGGVCKVPTCSDNKANGAETGKDCGNSAVTGCGLCPTNEGCSIAGDCISGVCTNKTCQAPTCSDLVQNRGETDIDCGGPGCGPCSYGSTCGGDLDCATGHCVTGKCDAQTLATGQDSPWGIAVDGQNVYWSTRTFNSTGTVMKVPLNGGAAVALATGLGRGRGIALDTTTNPTTVFFVDETQGTINRVSAAGGPITTMATGQNHPWAIVANATTVYWTCLGDGAVQKLASNVAGPTTPIQVSTASPGNPGWGIALDANNVYWANQGTGLLPATVTRADFATGTNTIIYTGVATANEVHNVVSAPGEAYFTDILTGLLSANFNGTSSSTIAASPAPQGLALYQNMLYWADFLVSGASVKKIGTNGVGATTLVTDQASPASLAVDGSSVYWTNFGDGTIKKVNR